MIRPPIKIHGGKFPLKDFLIDNFPKDYKDLTYVEIFGGGGSVILNKITSVTDIYNDLDENLYNIFYYLKNEPEKMINSFKNVEYNLATFESAKLNKTTDKFESAIREIIIRRMSRGGLGTHFSWSNRKRGNQPGDANAWQTFKEIHLPLICERLKNVEIYNENAITLIEKYQNDNKVLIYADPPYLPSTRSALSTYKFEMDENAHILLADALNKAKGKIMLSGYYSALYAKLYKTWRMQIKEVANHSSQSKKKQRRIECIWTNY